MNDPIDRASDRELAQGDRERATAADEVAVHRADEQRDFAQEDRERAAAADEAAVDWADEQRGLIVDQTTNISHLVESIELLNRGLRNRPTKLLVLTVVLVISLLSNAITIVVVLGGQSTLRANQEEAADRGKKIVALSERIDGCLDTSADDGDPIGKCAADNAKRTAELVEVIADKVVCSTDALFIEFLRLNPDLDIGVPAPRVGCPPLGPR